MLRGGQPGSLIEEGAQFPLQRPVMGTCEPLQSGKRPRLDVTDV